ncbi:MAG: hypothetical protein KBD06_02025 [Candidatus Pacebacteria bacterium]|nr:hypothetical protein [Candidatus Paceibacterota bacterium]
MQQTTSRLKLPDGVSPAMAWVALGGALFAILMPFMGMANGENYIKLAVVVGGIWALLPTPGTTRNHP